VSNNLNITQLTSAQENKEVTINDSNGELDAAITVQTDFTVDDTDIRTLTAAEFRRTNIFHIIDAGSPPDAAITITVPAVSRGIFALLNLTSFAVTVTIAAQPVTAPIVASGATTPSLLTCDGVNVRATI
jgi:hypothetical protein